LGAGKAGVAFEVAACGIAVAGGGCKAYFFLIMSS